MTEDYPPAGDILEEIDLEVSDLLYRLRSGLYNPEIDGTMEEILERLERMLT